VSYFEEHGMRTLLIGFGRGGYGRRFPSVGLAVGRSAGRAAMIAAFAAVAAVAAIAGCGTRAASVALPSKPLPKRPALGIVVKPSVRDLVISAYEGYWRATDEALASRDPARARAIMAVHVPRGALPALVKGLRALWRRNEIGYGSPVSHIMSVKFTGRATAAVRDCVDLSHTGLENRQTGQIVGGFGQSHEFLITTLARMKGRWLVTGAVPVVQACAY